jgi:tRNA-splicing endonuclease subunit Sen34
VTAEDILKCEAERIQQSMISNPRVYSQVPTQHPFPVASSSVEDFPLPDSSKYKVFRDLWSKGLYITTGDSFGGDFLVYPGDPVNFHASMIVHVVDPTKTLEIHSLTSCARLSVSVNKKCVFAYPSNDSDDKVTYQTLSWDNPKELFRKGCED